MKPVIIQFFTFVIILFLIEDSTKPVFSDQFNKRNQNYVDKKVANSNPDKSQALEKNLNNNLIVIIGASYAESWHLDMPKMTIVNKGKSGESSVEMLNRFETDVLSLKPRCVIIWGFINDIFNNDPQKISSTLATVKKNYETMVMLARNHDIIPILTTELTIRGVDNWKEVIANWVGQIVGRKSYQQYLNEHVLTINQWLREYAQNQNLILLDFQPLLSDDKNERKKRYAIPDGSHISIVGYQQLSLYSKEVLGESLK